jgi:hypothetical protein
MPPCRHDSQDRLMYVPETKTETSTIVWSKNYPTSSELTFLSDMNSPGRDVIGKSEPTPSMWFESLKETRLATAIGH